MGPICRRKRSAHSTVKTGWTIVLQVHVFTSAAANYLPKVRVLFDSLTEHHPEWRQHLLLVEDWSGPQCDALDLSVEVVQPRDLDIPNWRQWSFCHDLVELCTAVKPYMLSKLLAREDCDAVLYFDPDIKLFSRLDDLLGEFSTSSILLTPHQVAAESSVEAIISQEITSLKHGIYNLGFLGVKADEEGARFANWWGRRLYHFCRDDIPNGLFTDQRWIDFVPAFFERAGILRSPRFNVAAWNTTTRAVSRDADGTAFVNGEPLGFYHFTGLDSGHHDLQILKFAGEATVLSELLRCYQAEVSHYESMASGRDWSFSEFEDGTLIDKRWRAWYRNVPESKKIAPDPWLNSRYFMQLPDNKLAQANRSVVATKFEDEDPGFKSSAFLLALKKSIRKPRVARDLISRVWRIWRTEGVIGVKRRLVAFSKSEG